MIPALIALGFCAIVLMGCFYEINKQSKLYKQARFWEEYRKTNRPTIFQKKCLDCGEDHHDIMFVTEIQCYECFKKECRDKDHKAIFDACGAINA